MMRKTLAVLAAVALVSVAGCSLFRSPPPKLFPVDLCLQASPQLQWYKERSHTLYVRVYPLTVVDAFASGDVGELLSDPPPSIPGVIGTPQSRVLYPDTNQKLSFDAAEGQTFSNLGIVAGYYELKGSAKHLVNTADLRTGSCYTVKFGPSGIEGGAPATPKGETK